MKNENRITVDMKGSVMKKGKKIYYLITWTIVGILALCSFRGGTKEDDANVQFPYKKAGLTERQAAAHLLNRFTYGPTPGQINAVLEIGLEKWFQQQLKAHEADDSVDQILDGFAALKLSNPEIVKSYPKAGQVRRMATKEGIIDKDSVNTAADKKEFRKQLKAFMDQRGLKPEQDLIRQFINQKIIRAAFSKNQLQEVMTDFWFNHFNVSFTKNDCSQFIPDYERDVIRPNSLGSFETLLIATAKSPAMLMYLDNFSSTGPNAKQPMRAKKAVNQKNIPKKKMQGLNENYAREVMELHTLGVDGGYTQRDVTEAARVLTGWTIYPMNKDNPAGKMMGRLDDDKMSARGFVHDGDFLFAANRHDDGNKVVLGKTFDGSGYEEGVQLLKLLAHHSSTAGFISKKIAIRFVSDNPSQHILSAMAKTFSETGGDIKKVLITMVSSDEFWKESSIREKTKSPFELTISAVRILDAKISQPYQLFNWVTRMGQKIYYYQAPTGFPDKGQYWINTGSLLNRMNFGLAIAAGRIPGVKFDPLALNKNHEPASAEDALTIYTRLMLPERNEDATIRRLVPLLNDPELQNKIDKAALEEKSEKTMKGIQGEMEPSNAIDSAHEQINVRKKGELSEGNHHSSYTLSQVIGIIIGSPEFQRR